MIKPKNGAGKGTRKPKNKTKNGVKRPQWVNRLYMNQRPDYQQLYKMRVKEISDTSSNNIAN